jgi:hypothetical protein
MGGLGTARPVAVNLEAWGKRDKNDGSRGKDAAAVIF